MPIYEYDCAACGEDFEDLVLGAADDVACPGCGSEDVAKRFSVFGVSTDTRAPEAPPAGEFCGPGGGCGRPQCD